jgi:hypothetical protein
MSRYSKATSNLHRKIHVGLEGEVLLEHYLGRLECTYHVLGQLQRGTLPQNVKRKAWRQSDSLCSNEELRSTPSLLLDIDIKILCNVHADIAIWKLSMGSKSPEHQQTSDGMVSAFQAR